MAKELNFSFLGLEKDLVKKDQVEIPAMEWIPEDPQMTNEPSGEPSKEIEDIKSKIAEYQHSTKLKMDRLQNSIQKWEHNYSELSHDISSKIATLLQKLNEQKKYDQKVQDIVDRHNNLLKGYEVRMNQLQKLLQQKEMDYLEAHSALKEAKSEIARLKRL